MQNWSTIYYIAFYYTAPTGTDYKLPEDDAIASKDVGAV